MKQGRVTIVFVWSHSKMEGLLTKNNWLRFPPEPEEAKLNIIGGDIAIAIAITRTSQGIVVLRVNVS